MNTAHVTPIEAKDFCIHEWFEAEVDRAPHATALSYRGETWSYLTLDERANRLAHRLRGLSVGPDERVAICMASGPDRVVAVLAAWKAGGAYVPLDPAYPPDRLDYLLSDCKAKVLLTHDDVPPALRTSLADAPGSQATVVNMSVDTSCSSLSRKRVPRSVSDVSSRHLAYVIYTSGSTGRPKGVMVEHRGVCHLARAQRDVFAVDAHSRILQCASFSFDACLFEMVMALCNGAALYLPPAGTLAAGAVLAELLDSCAITHATLTPSVLSGIEMDPATLSALRMLVVAGEACTPALVDRWAPGRRFINAYGPTETTVWATWHECHAPAQGRPPIGRPVDGVSVHVLDARGQAVPVGEPGELYVGGVGVARGYLDRPELTHERFVDDPFGNDPGARLYRTGDIVRWRADGALDYLGRDDHQVKLRGLRIELGEIETSLSTQPGVRESAVLVREDVPGEKRLVAYVTRLPSATPDPLVLRQGLMTSLPEYMVPAAYVVLDTLPLTPNGKLDRDALPAPDDQAFARNAYVAPEGELEQTLADVWSDLLRVGRVGRDDHFFELGGHSLLAVQMTSRLRRRLGLEVAMTGIFDRPVLRDFAVVVGQAAPDTRPRLVATQRPERLPLSFAQQRLWFIAHTGSTAQAAYHLSVELRLHGLLDEAALRTALDRIVQRHEALRTHFHSVDGRPVQHVAELERFSLVRQDLDGAGPTATGHWRQREAAMPFDFEHGPLIRGRLLRFGEREHVLLLTMHHIVSDGWSMGVFAGELGALYRAYASQGVPHGVDPLPALPVQYADYALWQQNDLTGALQQRQLAFWRAQLETAPALVDLPMDKPRPSIQDYSGRSIPVVFDEQLTTSLKALSQRHGATLYMTLLAAWGALVVRLSGQDEVVIGSPVANRSHTEVEPLIGFFVNTLALRLDLGDRPSVAQLLGQVRDRVLQAQSHQDLPFEQVVEALRPQRTMAHSPIFQLMFAWQNAPRMPFELDGLTLHEVPVESVHARFDLTLELEEAHGRIVGSLCFATALYEPATVVRHLAYLEATLRGMVRDDTQAVDAIDILDDAGRRQLVDGCNDTARVYGHDNAVHRRFERQAVRTPDAIAVVHDDTCLTYRQLDEAANRLARHLQDLGVVAEERVALCLPRGIDLVLAMLATLKAGGAYVPLDPTHPAERWRDTLQDSTPKVVLTHAFLAAGKSLEGDWETLALDVSPRSRDSFPSTDVSPESSEPSSDRLAYVIYTSGSTGRPNGVMVEHRQLANLIAWHTERFPLSPGERTSSTAGVAFDACTWEVWPALCSGATLVLPPASTVGDPAALLDWWETEELTTSFLVTALADAALSRGQAGCHGLRQLLTGGDRLNRLPEMGLPFELVNNYGPTETTVVATSGALRHDDAVVHIGRPIANTRIYLLDRHGQPVPWGTPGEMHIGGAQVARGYLNRPDLTRTRFLPDPFVTEPTARMYKTGDLGRWLPDGTIEYLGRNDQQVKIRGLRIEPGEIEAQLRSQPSVREVAVLAREDVPGEHRLVAYVVPDDGEHPEAQVLRDALASVLPAYMIPVAYVLLHALPFTPNGKLDRRALPPPDDEAFAQRAYEAPQGEVEVMLAQIWGELLHVDRVGRQDNFFELGGHSLLAMQLMERMRQHGMHADIATLFARPTLAALAEAVQEGAGEVRHDAALRADAIPEGCDTITPTMVPLVDLDPAQIERIVSSVPGGTTNVKDIYPLAPLQEGILFHHLLHRESDPYLLSITLGFATRAGLDDFAHALQHVIDRHDVLRTGFVWEGVDAPVQVVWRQATLEIETKVAAGGDIEATLDRLADSRHTRLDLQHAPLMRGHAILDEPRGRWLLQLVHHHLVLDHTALDILFREIALIQSGRSATLATPVPFRHFVAQARLGMGVDEHQAFFQRMLGDVDEPTAPFGLLDVHANGMDVDDAKIALPMALSRRLRRQARLLGVGTASLFHWAWAQVLAKTTGRDDVVFGTVLFGRLQGGTGTDRAMGLFINTLPIRVGLGDVAVQDGVRRTHALLSELVRHEHASLALAQRCSALPAHAPLFSSLLNYRHSGHDAGNDWMHGHDIVSTHERTSYPVDLSVDDHGEGFTLSAQAARPIDARRICDYMSHALAGLADALEHHPRVPSWQIDVMDESERDELLALNPKGEGGLTAGACVHELFQYWASATPRAIALVHEAERLDYRELDERANRLAHYLRELGVGPEERVALCLPRGVDMIVALLAAWKAGGAYVPLDPAYPRERLEQMLRDSRPRVVLAHEGQDVPPLPDHDMTIVALDGLHRPWNDRPSEAPALDRVGVHAGHLAYVIYTSGSTGEPKGVAVEHGALYRRIVGLAARYGFQSSDRILQFASINFDASVEEILGALTQGATLVLRTPEWLDSATAFWKLCAASRITVVDLPTKFWQQLARDRATPVPDAVRTTIIGGEAVDPQAILDWLDGPGHRPRLFNTYGPTEALVVATVQEIRTPGDTGIGRPVADTAIYVLDRHGRQVPADVVGEIHIGGAGLARGYFDRPDLTAERFVRDPFVGRADARMYRTGDLGRWRSDGTLDYLGRNDQQVKIRGFRIEPAEIEARLTRCEGIREAAVLPVDDAAGGQRLVAYVVGEAVADDPRSLRASLATVLPDYMLPVAYVRLDALPLTPAGKLDRRSLPAPDGAAFAQRSHEVPQGEVEIALARIWARLLAVDEVGRHDHFFELGGHSLLAVQLMEYMRREGMHADIRVLFARPTLSALAQAVEEARHDTWQSVTVPANGIPQGATTITPAMLPLLDIDAAQIERIVATVTGGAANVQDIYPLAPLQEGILFHHLLQTRGDPYLLSTILSFDSRARLDAFVGALQQVIDRHDVLRTAVLWEGLAEPVQVVWREALLEVATLDLPGEDAASRLAAHTDPRTYRLDVRQAPLMQGFAAFDTQSGRWLLSLLQHHLAMDHVSGDLILEEVGQILTGGVDALPVPVPFRNFVAQARLGVSEEEHAAFFGRMLGDVDEPTAPFGMLDVHGDGENVREAQQALPADLARRLRKAARGWGVSAASLFHWAWAKVLAKTTGREDVVFGTVLFGRLQGGEGADRAMGLFINTLPIRIGLGDMSVREGIRRTHADLSALLHHEHASLALAQRCSALPSGMPLFSALLNYRHSGATEGSDTPAWATGVDMLAVEERTNYPFTLSVDDLGEGFILSAQIAKPIEAERICDYMRHALLGLVEHLETTPETPSWRVDVLGDVERRRVLLDWNDTRRDWPHPDDCIHERFERQVARTPQAVALESGTHRLTYAELNERANRLAHFLRERGVVPEQRVALCMHRGVDMVVAIYAVLKAGGAYVPLDPSYPADRLAYMLRDSRPRVLLTQVGMRAMERQDELMVLELDAPQRPWEGYPASNPTAVDTGLHARHLAYVIYTSGSTGQPKGVMIEHAGVVNRMAWMQEAYGLTAADAVLQKTPFGFDVSVWEFFWPLAEGARLVMARPEGHKDPAYLVETIRAHGITTVHFVPSLLQVFVEAAGAASCDSLLRVVCSGEALPGALARRVRDLLPHASLHNLYGPTEATVDVTAWTCDAHVLPDNIPIGAPIANTAIYILDSHGQPVPPGVPGEIHIGGVQVARGYLNRPDLTLERFVPDPFSAATDGRMYTTGDLGRWLPDGTVEYLGRNDHQVKIRGLRIELGEIEASLVQQPGVHAAVVLAPTDASGDRRLVAYIVAEVDESLDVQALRRALSRQLPDYMLPAAWMVLDALPLTPNGKLDRRALPAPDGSATTLRGYVEPRGPVETALARIWSELLRLERVGRNDHFFELGGHSLLAVRMISRLRQHLGLEVALPLLFAHPVMHDFARMAAETKAIALPELVRGQRPDTLPVSSAQRRLWLAAQLGEDASAAYHMPIGLRLAGRLDEEALRATLDRIVQRHEALRTYFVRVDGEPVQRIAAFVGFSLDRHALHVSPDARDDAIRAAALDEASKPFDLEHGPLIRGVLLHLDTQDHVLLMTMHHLVSDGWSLGVLADELGAIYRAYTVDGVSHAVDPLPALPVQYADYALWQRRCLDGDYQEKLLDYWCSYLAGSSTLSTLPTDRPRPPAQAFVGGMVHGHVSKVTTERLHALAGRHSGTAFMVLMAAFNVLLSRYSGQDDLNVGTVVANRDRSELEPLIGLLLDTQVVRTRIDPEQDFVALLHQVRENLIQGHLHQALPFDTLLERLKPTRHPGVTPLFQVMLQMQNLPEQGLALPDLTLHALPPTEYSVKFDLTIYVTQLDGALDLAYEYDVALFDQATIQRLASRFTRLLDAVVAAPETRVEDLDTPMACHAVGLPPSSLATPERIESWMLYWRSQLRGPLQAMQLPLNRPRPSTPSFTAAHHVFAIEETLGHRLHGFAHAHAIPVEDVLLTGFNALLRRYTGHDELIVGTTVPTSEDGAAAANAVILRTRVAADATFMEALVRVAHVRRRALQHGGMPIERLVEALGLGADTSRSWPFDVMFMYDEAAVRSSGAGVDIHLHVTPRGDAFDAHLTYNAELLDEARIGTMMRHFVRLLREMADNPAQRIADAPMLDDAERKRQCVTWNQTRRPYPQATVHAQFEAQAARTPGALALRFGDTELSYAALDDKADRLARYLREAGVGAGETVGIHLPRLPALLIAVLGVLKAGGAYVPLEPSLPAQRLAAMIRDAGMGWVVLESKAMQTLPLQGVDVVLMDGAADDADWLADYVEGALPTVDATDPAYVMYTSGSTGQPKGVMVEHRSLSSYLAHAVVNYLPDVTGSVVSSPLCFDATLTTLLPPLLAGKPVWLLPDDDHVLANLSARLFAPGDGWLFKITPAHLDALSFMERDLPSGTARHCIVVGGEQLTSPALRRWKGDLLPHARFVNEYGPTETVVGCSVWTLASAGQLDDLRGTAVPIGRAIGNTRLYVLGAERQVLPEGCVGELYIGGEGVARGYLNEVALTQDRFIADPFGDGRLYKTGDLVRFVGEAELEFVGRIDEQVKIRGFRIELGEIEALLVRQVDVREAVVLAREDSPGDRRLVAYVLGEAGCTPDGQVLRKALAQALPDYMLPAAVVHLPAWPLTANGKLDRRALPTPEDAGSSEREYDPPQGEIETILARLWSELLRVERVGRNDHFFERGGHSLLAVQLMERMRREGLHVDVRVLFVEPTLCALAKAVEDNRREGWQGVIVPANGIPAGCAAITPDMLPLVTLQTAHIERIVGAVPGGTANVQDIYPLAPLQEGILFHHQLQTRGDAYLSSTLLAFDSSGRRDAFVHALQRMVDRHDVLRTSVLWSGLPEPVQVVWREARLEVVEPGIEDGDVPAKLAELTDSRHLRMDLQQAPLMRGYSAFDAEGQRWLLQLVHHHLVLDHTALDVLLQEIGMILSGRGESLAPPVPFRNFVAQARLGVGLAEHEAFFRDMLGDVDEATAPFDRMDVHGDGDNVHEAHVVLPMALSRRLRRQARGLGVGAASLFHWAWAQVLAKTTGRDDVVFGTVLFGRLHGSVGTDRTMGLLINTLPIRVKLGEVGVGEGVRQTHAALSGLMRHEHASLALAQRCSAMPANTPLFSSLLNYRHSEDVADDAATPDWAQGLHVLSSRERTNYPFMMSVDDLGEGFELSSQIAEPIDALRMCDYMRHALDSLADALEEAPSTPSWHIGILGEVERRRLLLGGNPAPEGGEKDTSSGLHERFERQAAATPDAIALAVESESLTYREVNEAANRLARYLRGQGVGPDDRVAIGLRRDSSMVVAVLAVLKAGGAYVPVDPAYPRQRLHYMLHDSRPRIVITQAGAGLPCDDLPTIELDGAQRPWESLACDDLGIHDIGLCPDHLAYVIYTSGSTGQPKGVAITHANAVNFITWATQAFTADELRHTLFSTSLNFDLAVFECFAPLSRGGCVHLVDNILALAERQVPVSLINTVPSALKAILDRQAIPSSVRVVNVAGEPLKRQLAEALFESTGVATLCNLYGPSETTTYSTWVRMDRNDGFDMSVGRPIANTTVYLLDAHGQLVPEGVIGEVFIGGSGVARGYLDRPELTGERFVRDFFSTHQGARMYRTGDLGRWLPDGRLEYLGRNDHQVKIRGFRIELGEIEAHLLAATDVSDAVVVARDDMAGSSRLVAYVAGVESGGPDVSALRRVLADALPGHMVPTAWVVLAALPLTPNGKVDRGALPAPADTGLAADAHEAPEGPVESVLAGIWCDLLGVQRIGRHDHFFELGGHSLLATQLISRVRNEWGIEVPLVTVFANARLREFADAIVDCQLSQFDIADLERIVAEQRGATP